MPRIFTGQSECGKTAGFPPTLEAQIRVTTLAWLKKQAAYENLRDYIRAIWSSGYMAGWAAHRRAIRNQPSLLEWEHKQTSFRKPTGRPAASRQLPGSP